MTAPTFDDEAALLRRLDPLGIAWVVWSGIRMVSGLFVVLMFVGFALLFAQLPSHHGEPPPMVFAAFFGVFGVLVGGLAVLMSGFGIAVGLALRKGERWAMIAAAILGMFQMLSIPVGLALGIWTLVVVSPELSRPKA